MNKLKILATGTNGLVGSRICELLSDSFDFTPLTHDIIDITNKDQVYKKLKEANFDIFLHMAAYTNVDKAESDRQQAYELNVHATDNLFSAVQEKQKKFIYMSTGFVFDGSNPPYYEESIPSPISYYGETKYQGEMIVKNNGMIVRIEYPFRKHFLKKNDFVRTIVQLLQKKQRITMVNDSIFTPTYIDDIASGLKYLFTNFSTEIFHLVGSRSYSPYEAGLLIAKTYNLDSSFIHPISYDAYFKDKAKRPKRAEVKSHKNNFQKMNNLEEALLLMNM